MRKATFLAVLVLLLGVAGLAQAQDHTVACGQLSEADCALLAQSQEALAELSSYGVTISGNFSLNNIPDTPGAINITLAGTGAVSGDLSGIHLSQDQAMGLAGDPKATAEYISRLLENINAQAALTITLPEEIVAQTGGQLPATIPLELRLVDGVAYLNLGALRDALGQQGASVPEGWYGLNLPDLFERMMTMSSVMGAGTAQAMNPEMMSHFTDPDVINEFVRVERLDDTTDDDGTDVASFHTVIDYQALFSDPTMLDLMEQSMREQGAELSEEEMAQATNMMQQMAQGLTFELFQTIGLEDNLPRSVQVTFNWNMQSMVDAMIEAGEGDMGLQGPAPAISFNLVVNYQDFNAVEDITAPEDATIVPLDTLMGGMSGMQQAAPAGAAEMTPTPQG